MYTSIEQLIQRELYSYDIFMQTDDIQNVLNSKVFKRGDSLMSTLVNNGDAGMTFEVPYVKPLEYSEAIAMDLTDNEITPEAVEKATYHFRLNGYAKSWGFRQLAAEVSAGVDPYTIILSRISQYWGLDIQTRGIAALKGAVASTPDVVLDVTAETENVLTYNTAIEALDAVGDSELGSYGALICHSRVKNNLLKNDAVNINKVESENGFLITYWNGLEVIVNDSIGKIDNGDGTFTYTSYITKPGAIIVQHKNMDILKDEDVVYNPKVGQGSGKTELITRMMYVVHIDGFDNKYTAQAGTNNFGLTVADFSTAANWSRVVSKKQTPFVAIKTLG